MLDAVHPLVWSSTKLPLLDMAADIGHEANLLLRYE